MTEESTRQRGRRPKYDWTDKRDACYRLYVEEKRPMSDVVDYFANQFGLTDAQIPTPRDFTRQFGRWNFPTRRKKLPTEDEAQLIEQVKQLWAANYVQKRMLDTLQNDGWDIDELTLGRLRRKHGLVMRVANGYNKDNMGPGTGKKRKRSATEDMESNLSIVATDNSSTPLTQPRDVQLLDTRPEEAARRAQRLAELQAYSDTQMQAKKRRRRIRGLGPLPPDEPGLPPRYKSETSLDECKAFLELSNNAYKEVRQKFQEICENNNVIKKTECEPGDWQAVKDQLVRNNTHLQATLHPLHDNYAERQNALEVICSDVTKRMRTALRRISLKDANNILGLNPEQSKEVRRHFYEVLKADDFQTMLLCGKEHWEELRKQWVQLCPEAQQLYEQELDEKKKKCIEILLRDAMKRHNDNNVSKMQHMVRAANSYGPGPGPAPRSKADAVQQERTEGLAGLATLTSPVPSNMSRQRKSKSSAALPAQSTSSDSYAKLAHSSNVDPALYAMQPPAAPLPRQPASAAMTSPQELNKPLSAYFRLSADSGLTGKHQKIWLATLQTRSIDALHAAAKSKSPSARIRMISGIVKNNDSGEDVYQIDGQDEFEAYLDTIAELASGKATFIVALDAAAAAAAA